MVSFKEFLLMEALNSDKDIEDFLINGKDEIIDIIEDFDSIDSFSKTEDLTNDEKNEFIKYIIVYIGYNKLNPNFINTIKDEFSNNGTGFKGVLNKNGLPVSNDFINSILSNYLDFDAKRNSAKITKLKETINSNEDFLNDMGLAPEDDNASEEDDKDSDDKNKSSTNDKAPDDESSSQDDDASQKELQPTEDKKQKPKIVGAKNLSATFGNLPVRELRDALNAGDLDKSRETLDKWKKQVEDKISEFIDAKNNEVEENKKYLREEKEILWEGILQNFKDRKDVKYKKEKGVKSIYDGDTNTSHYIEQLDNIFNQTEAKIEKICGRINDYNISNKERNEIKQRALNIIDNLINSSYSLIRDVKKNASKTRFLERSRINYAKQKEREDEEYENSFRGEDLKKKASIFAQNFADTFVAAFKVNQVKNIDDIAKKQILDLIAESDGNVQTFIKLVNSKQVLSPIDGEPVMYAVRWLSNKGLKVPSNISSKDIDLLERKPEVRGIKEAFELIKQKIGTEVTPPYPDGVIANIVRSVRNIADNKDSTTRQTLINNLLASKENKEYPNEVKIIANKFMVNLDSKPQDEQTNANSQNANSQNANSQNANSQNANDQNVNDQNNKQKKLTRKERIQAKKIEDAGKVTQETMQEWPAVTTAKCDGLPIGARKYSRAIRRRMNYALNKYM